MIDSPCHPYGDTNFIVTEGGVSDPMEKKTTTWKSSSKSSEKRAATKKDEDDEDAE